MSIVASLDEMMRRYASKRTAVLKQIEDDEAELKRVEAQIASTTKQINQLDANMAERRENSQKMKSLLKEKSREIQVRMPDHRDRKMNNSTC